MNQAIWKNRTKITSVSEQNGFRIKVFQKPERTDIDGALLKWFKQGGSDSVRVTSPLLKTTFDPPKFLFYVHVSFSTSKRKGKAVPLQAWSDPEGSRKIRFPDFMTTAQDGGKVVSLTHRPPLPPGNIPGTHFC